MPSEKAFQAAILQWYKKYGRKDLPWQHNKTPYRVWVSEIMLQQTQVKTVIPYYLNFMEQFPSIEALSKASLDEVMQHWAGLGYYSRARNLHKAACQIMTTHACQFPTDIDAVIALPGIGESTAAAILSFSLKQSHAILDGNVKRILARLHCIDSPPEISATKKSLWKLAKKYTPQNNTDLYNQAIMDIGATVCTLKKPACHRCPVQSFCQSYIAETQLSYPVKKVKKLKAVRKIHCLTILSQNKDHVLLERRPNSGIWGGLWVLPEIEQLDQLSTWLKQNLKISHYTLNTLPCFPHELTHISLKINPYQVITKKRNLQQAVPPYAWHKLSTISQLGLSKHTKDLLEPLQIESLSTL